MEEKKNSPSVRGASKWLCHNLWILKLMGLSPSTNQIQHPALTETGSRVLRKQTPKGLGLAAPCHNWTKNYFRIPYLSPAPGQRCPYSRHDLLLVPYVSSDCSTPKRHLGLHPWNWWLDHLSYVWPWWDVLQCPSLCLHHQAIGWVQPFSCQSWDSRELQRAGSLPKLWTPAVSAANQVPLLRVGSTHLSQVTGFRCQRSSSTPAWLLRSKPALNYSPRIREQLEDILEEVDWKATLPSASSTTTSSLILPVLLLTVTSTFFTSFHENECIQSFLNCTRSPGLNWVLLQREMSNPTTSAGQYHESPIEKSTRKDFSSLFPKLP